MPKFTLRDLFLCVSLSAVGLGCFGLATANVAWLGPPLFVLSIPLICAGLGALYQKPFQGFAFGVVGLAIFLFLIGIM